MSPSAASASDTWLPARRATRAFAAWVLLQTASGRCSQKIPAAPGTTFQYRVGLLPDGSVVTGQSGDGAATKLVVFEGLSRARERAFADGATFMGVAFDRVIALGADRKEILLLDPSLATVETLPLHGISCAACLALWSEQREFLIVDWNNQVHHFGDPSLRPSTPETEAPAPRKKSSRKKT